MRNVLIILIIFISLGATQIRHDDVGLIPETCQVDWTVAGLLPSSPQYADHVVTVPKPEPGVDWSLRISQAIETARSKNGIKLIYLPEGDYTLTSSINLVGSKYSNIIFQGAGSNETRLFFKVGTQSRCFYFMGNTEDPDVSVSSIYKGNTEIQATDLSTFSANMWIQLVETKHPDLVDWAQGKSGQINQIISVKNNRATLKYEASKYFNQNYDIKIKKQQSIMNVGIENLKIIRMDKGNHTDGANIYMRYAVNCWVKGVESEYTCKHHIECFDCAHIKISGCYFHNARNFGGKGRGYGVSLAFSTSYCLIENNIFRRLRHAMSLEAGANTNVFTYNFSTDQTWSGFFWRPDGWGAEICLHGSLPFANLFEQNIVEQIQADGWNTPNGPYNTFVRNMIWDVNEKQFNTMYLVGAEKTNVLGCIIKSQNTCHPFYPFTGCGETTFCTDIFGWDKEKFRSHNFKSDLPKTEYILGDISYFYSSRPDFVSSNFSWPSVGPKVSSELLVQNIPAKERFYSNTKKTYLAKPTSKPN